jgi:hypothetical protein
MDRALESAPLAPFDGVAHRWLLQEAERPEHPGRVAWQILEAAHIWGQEKLGPHWRTHWAMLRRSMAERNPQEAASQLLRLTLVPLGHATGRLPWGNPGTSRVSAFAPAGIGQEPLDWILRASEPPHRQLPPL